MSALAVFSRRLGILLGNGVPVVQALGVVGGEAPPALGEAVAQVREAVREGRAMAEAMAEYPAQFPAYFRAIARQGELLGRLDIVLEEGAELVRAVAARRGPALGEAALEQAVGVLLFTQQVGDLVRAGIWWGRALRLLELEAPAALREVPGQLLTPLPDVPGWQPLSRRLEHRTDLFSPGYRAMVRAGEQYGSVQEEALRHLAALLEEDLRLSQAVEWPEGRPSALVTLGRPTAEAWVELTEPQRRLLGLLFCRAMSMLLSLGAPVEGAAETASWVLPGREQATLSAFLEEGLPKGLAKGLRGLGFLPESALALVRAGEVSERLEYALNGAAEAAAFELGCS